MKKINWGIIGLGKIANKFANDLAEVEDAKLYAVASRNREKAEEFALNHQAELAYGAYSQLIEDANIDVIYIATPHIFHYELTLECLKNGKAVLCEKPFAMNTGQALEMIKVSRSKNVFLMEALWTKFLPHFEFAEEKLKSGEMGKIKSIKADFGFKAEFDETKRLFNKSLGGGSLLDIGIYPVFLAYSLLGMPEEIQASAEFSETGVDSSCQIRFKYTGQVQAELYSTFKEKTPTIAEIELEKGKMIINERFHEPTSVTIIEEGKEETKEFGVQTTGYYFEAAHVGRMLTQGKTESDQWSLDHTKDLMQLLDKIREQIGLEY
ncbi:Gfo/Idh/MocA family oxidoreductase [Pontixanthobacter gangjinensis]|uniref:Gfo/Idh/MocA family oxidoreductase n=1 Tax=Christiangramia aestuarii TaxID=1028746 RepID=A0A7K1LQD0_9FLAO|nr:Gfo/Idh/MocA family oxidoreductase [Christiangramia aestuarii]MUP42968.1 Gfo/Idh/MocA family oxidoreductase [Christiangramia aestuarii]